MVCFKLTSVHEMAQGHGTANTVAANLACVTPHNSHNSGYSKAHVNVTTSCGRCGLGDTATHRSLASSVDCEMPD